MKKNLILLGMMGVGKTAVGKVLAKKLNFKFIDTDLNIEKKCSMKISEIFKKKGESFFRQEEEKEVTMSLKKTNSVIALGGGAFLNKNVRDLILKNSVSFWLDVSLKTINRRIKWNNKRPLLSEVNAREIIKRLYDERKNIYKLAKYKINCNNLTKNNIVKRIIYYYEK